MKKKKLENCEKLDACNTRDSSNLRLEIVRILSQNRFQFLV